MDTPGRSSMDQPSRFSTPAPELDDHRTADLLAPPSALHSATSPERPGRKISISTHSRHDQISLGPPSGKLEPFPKELENAITDDDGEGIPANANGSTRPRRGLSKRIQQRLADAGHSHESSPSSSRSSSPPNSVDAFAEPRIRERGFTINSKAGSDLGIPIARTISGGASARRPTFGSGNGRPEDVQDDSDRPEEDVCFPPMDVPTKTFSIDFEEIEEFVAESKRDRPNDICRRRHSFSSSGVAKLPCKARARAKITSSHESLSPAADSLEEQKLGEKSTAAIIEAAPREVNRFVFFSSELEKTIHAPELGDLIEQDESFRDLFDVPEDAGAWWLDVLNPTEDELEMFQKAFGIHRLTAEDIEQMESREKVELFPKYYFVSFRSFVQNKKSEEYLEPVNAYMVVFREGILTFSYTENPHAQEVRRRIGKLRNYINLTADWICYALIDNIVDSFGPPLRDVERQTDAIEDNVFVARTEDFAAILKDIGDCRKTVMQLMRLLGGKADVIKGFAKRCNEQYKMTPRGEIGLYLGDIQDHVVTMMSSLSHFEKMLSRSHSNYLAQLSVDNIAQGNRANEVLSKITLVATILVPMNLICGLFGMNVPVPGGLNPGPLNWFFGILGVIIGFMVLGYFGTKWFFNRLEKKGKM